MIDAPDTRITLSLTLASIVFDTDIDITSDFTLAAELVTTHGNGYEFYYAFHCMPFAGTSRDSLMGPCSTLAQPRCRRTSHRGHRRDVQRRTRTRQPESGAECPSHVDGQRRKGVETPSDDGRLERPSKSGSRCPRPNAFNTIAGTHRRLTTRTWVRFPVKRSCQSGRRQ